MYNKDILRQKDSDLQLTPSQLFLGIGIAFFVMALAYYLLDKSRFHIKSKLQLKQYLLVTPLILILYVTNFLQTYFPETGFSDFVEWIFGILTIISVFAFIPGIIMFFVNIVIGLNTKKP